MEGTHNLAFYLLHFEVAITYSLFTEDRILEAGAIIDEFELSHSIRLIIGTGVACRKAESLEDAKRIIEEEAPYKQGSYPVEEDHHHLVWQTFRHWGMDLTEMQGWGSPSYRWIDYVDREPYLVDAGHGLDARQYPVEIEGIELRFLNAFQTEGNVEHLTSQKIERFTNHSGAEYGTTPSDFSPIVKPPRPKRRFRFF